MFENVSYREFIYSHYRNDPQSVPAEWRDYFQGAAGREVNGDWRPGPSFTARSLFATAGPASKKGFHADPRARRPCRNV